MTLNLVQHRGVGATVGARAQDTLDVERWLAMAGATTLLTSGLRRRSATGLIFVLGATGLAWWAATHLNVRRARRESLRARLPWGRTADVVTEASESSFPASDPPSWTSTTATHGGADAGTRH